MKRALVAMAVVAIGGCDINVHRTGPVEHETQSIELDKSEMVRVELDSIDEAGGIQCPDDRADAFFTLRCGDANRFCDGCTHCMLD